MSLERSGNRYTGPKLSSDQKEVIADTPIAGLSKEAQAIYLNGGYHTLVIRLAKHFKLSQTTPFDQEAFLKKRIARELIALTADAHKNKGALAELLSYFDRVASPDSAPHLTVSARRIAEYYVQE